MAKAVTGAARHFGARTAEATGEVAGLRGAAAPTGGPRAGTAIGIGTTTRTTTIPVDAGGLVASDTDRPGPFREVRDQPGRWPAHLDQVDAGELARHDARTGSRVGGYERLAGRRPRVEPRWIEPVGRETLPVKAELRAVPNERKGRKEGVDLRDSNPV